MKFDVQLPYGATNPNRPPDLSLFRSFDTNDRLVKQTTINATRGSTLFDGQTFTVSDGVDTVTFEFDDTTLLAGDPSIGVTAGNIRVPFRPVDTDDTVAKAIRDQINSASVQAVLLVKASLSDGDTTSNTGTSARVNLFGNAIVSGLNVTQFGTGEQNYGGDANHFRDQGQVILQGNRVSQASQFGILVDAGDRDFSSSGEGIPHPGSVRVTRELNVDRLYPGVTVTNNILDRNRSGGIHFSGDANPNGSFTAAVPFGRIVNNTVFGLGTTDIGIRVSENASPTLMNNIVANVATGINVDGTSLTTVIGTTLFQNATVLGSVGNFPIALLPNDPLFANTANQNFYLAAGSKAIDSSLNSLDDRFDFANRVKASMGIPQSPIFAPDRDITGQIRSDDSSAPNTSPQGASVVKDRGAIDRADFIGLTASLLDPQDNDTLGADVDGTATYVQVLDATLNHFKILLVDGNGTGPDDSTVLGLALTVTEDGEALTEGVDYTFGYNSTSNTILITPTSGIWKPGSAYEITLNNRDRVGVLVHSGISVHDGDQFTILDTSNANTTFEFESGYTLTVPETMAIHVPIQGAKTGGVADGETFTVASGATTVTFEFDSNSNFNATSTPVAITNNDDADSVADKIVFALNAAGLGLSARNLGNGVVHLGSRSTHTLDTPGPTLTQTGVAAGIADADRFTIWYAGQPETFEYTTDNTLLNNANHAIVFSYDRTHEEIAQLTVEAIRNLNPNSPLALTPTNLGGGRIHVVGADGYAVNTANSVLAQLRQEATSTTSGTIVLEVPVNGAAGITDGDTFTISRAGKQPVRFEFDNNFSTARGAVRVPFSAGQNRTQIVSTLVGVMATEPTLGLNPVARNGWSSSNRGHANAPDRCRRQQLVTRRPTWSR